MINLFFFHGAALFIGNGVDPDIHQHHVMEIFISLNRTLKINNNNKDYEAKNIIVGSDESHQIESDENLFAIILLENESVLARQLKKIYLNENGINLLPDCMFLSFKEDLHKLLNTNCKITEAKTVYNKIIHSLVKEDVIEINEFDQAIQKVIKYLTQLPEKKIKIKELASIACMSESRLIHLFTKQIGIPIRRYLLWLRLLNAINLIIKGTDFTGAAYDAGFSDSAHLSRTFKKMFGLKLTKLFKNYRNNSHFVQVKTESF